MASEKKPAQPVQQRPVQPTPAPTTPTRKGNYEESDRRQRREDGGGGGAINFAPFAPAPEHAPLQQPVAPEPVKPAKGDG